MTDTTELLKNVSAELAKATSEFSRKAEDALGEAKKAGTLSAETKAAVDELALKFNSLTEAEKQLKAQLGEMEQEFARLPAQGTAQARDGLGATVIKSEALKAFAASIEGGKRINIPVSAALLSTDVAQGIVEPQRLPGIDVAPKQRLFIRDLIAPGRTSSPAIFWVQQTGFTNAARVVAEGMQKPYSNIEFASKLTAVSTYRPHVQSVQADPGRLRAIAVDHRRGNALRPEICRGARNSLRRRHWRSPARHRSAGFGIRSCVRSRKSVRHR